MKLLWRVLAECDIAVHGWFVALLLSVLWLLSAAITSHFIVLVIHLSWDLILFINFYSCIDSTDNARPPYNSG